MPKYWQAVKNCRIFFANLIVNKKIDINSVDPKNLVVKVQPQTNKNDLEKAVKEVLKQNPKAIADYKKGKVQVIGFLIGSVMKILKGQANPTDVKRVVETEINNI